MAFVACGGGGGAAPPPRAPVRPLANSDRLYFDAQSGITDSLDVVVRDDRTYQDRWRAVTMNRRRPPPAPPVDFSSHMVVIAAAGALPGQSRIRIDSTRVVGEQDALGSMSNVLVVWETVARSCSGASGIDDYPVAVARVPRFSERVRFVRIEESGPGC